MQISEITANMKNVNTMGEIKVLGEIREVNKKDGTTGRVRDATLDDGSGQIKLSLWDDAVTKFSVGDKVEIENGYTSSYRDVVQLGVGRFGKIETITA